MSCRVFFPYPQDFIESTCYYAPGGPQAGIKERLTPQKFNFLNTDAGLQEAVGILECAFAQWGIENTLAFVRQGASGFNPDTFKTTGKGWRLQCNFTGVAGRDFVPKSNKLAYNICEYLQCIKRSMRYIDEHEGEPDKPSVWNSDERPDIICHYI
jgi:hypothetical protein